LLQLLTNKVPGIPYRGFAPELHWGILSAISKIPSFDPLWKITESVHMDSSRHSHRSSRGPPPRP